MIIILTDLSFLEKGKPFPPPEERERLQRYESNRLLFQNEHAEVYKEQFRRIERVIGNFEEIVSYETIFNYQKLMTLKIADFVCGSPPKITVSDDNRQKIVDRIIFDTDLYNKLYMSVIDLSRYGDSVPLVTRTKNGTAAIDIISPLFWFPVVCKDNIKEIQYHCFAQTYIIDSENEKYGLSVQIHKPDEPGKCENHRYELIGRRGSFTIGRELTEKAELRIETAFGVCPAFPVSNTPTSDSVFGIDDYGSVDSIVSELEIRVSQISKVLDKFSSPSMAGPSSMLTVDEATGEYRLRFGNYFPVNNRDDPMPEMITWDAGLDANFKQIEILTNQLYTISEMGAAVFGDLSNSAGNVASGTALRRLMISPLAKARRITQHYERVIKDIISLCAIIYGAKIDPTEITVNWNDGLPSDPVEEANIINLRTGGKATLSRWTAIQRFDKMSDSDTDTEIKMIDEDEAAATAGEIPVNEPEDTVVDE